MNKKAKTAKNDGEDNYYVFYGKQGKGFFEMFDARLINLYGPTEGDITSWECPRLSPGETMDRTPVGKPTSNAKVYILDSDMQPVPVGATGEVHFGGRGIARGYLNKPDLTQEKFVKNPFARRSLIKTYMDAPFMSNIISHSLVIMRSILVLQIHTP